MEPFLPITAKVLQKLRIFSNPEFFNGFQELERALIITAEEEEQIVVDAELPWCVVLLSDTTLVHLHVENFQSLDLAGPVAAKSRITGRFSDFEMPKVAIVGR